MARRLMVIDDDAGICRVIGLVAGHLELEFQAVTNPFEAVERYLNYRPDLVILDMIMPGKDGIEVLGELLKTGIRSHVVLTSGHGPAYLRLAQGIARFHQAEPPSLLAKPFRRQQLIDLLTDLLTAASSLTC